MRFERFAENWTVVEILDKKYKQNSFQYSQPVTHLVPMFPFMSMLYSILQQLESIEKRRAWALCGSDRIYGQYLLYLQVTDTGLCKLIQNAPLVELVLSAAKEITDKSIFMMASSISSSLEKLYVSGCNLISPHVLRYLKVKSSKLCFIMSNFKIFYLYFFGDLIFENGDSIRYNNTFCSLFI